MMADDDCRKLMQWAARQGITDQPRPSSASVCLGGLGCSVRVGSFPETGGRGLAATRDIMQGELILRVPHAALLSLRSAMQDLQFARVSTLVPKLSSTQMLTVYLLYEMAKGKASSWYEYLQSLPRLHQTLAHFSNLESEALQVEDAVWVAQRAAEKGSNDWKAAKELIQELGLRHPFSTLKAWIWAAATVSSRTLHVPWDEAGTLCPIGDLFNYASPGEAQLDSVVSSDSHPWMPDTFSHIPDCSQTFFTFENFADLIRHIQSTVRLDSFEYDVEQDPDDDYICSVTLRDRLRDGGFEEESNEYCFYARQDYQAGQQVLLCYGEYSNLELLEHYGFLLDHNPNDKAHLALPSASEFGYQGVQLPPCNNMCIQVTGRPSFSMLARLRLHAMQPSLRKAQGHLALSGKRVSVDSDIAICLWLQKKCEHLLANLPTCLTDDLILMSLLNWCENLKVCVCSLLKNLNEKSSPATQTFTAHEPASVQDVGTFVTELEKFVSTCGDHVCVYGNTDHIGQSKSCQQLERWKLAIKWRISHKCILRRCISYCAKKIKYLIKYKTS